MPIYDYQCSSCGFKKEVMRKISEPNLTVCSECGKQISFPGKRRGGVETCPYCRQYVDVPDVGLTR